MPPPVSLELSPEQQRDYDENKGFNVRGSDGELYRIIRTPLANNVLGRKRRRGNIYALGCNPTGSSRVMDRHIAQKVLLECDAPTFVEMSCIDDCSYSSQLALIGDYDGAI